jgi:hypothetical protein
MEYDQWGVFVPGIGRIGAVCGSLTSDESTARLVALSKYSEEGNRPAGSMKKVIYEDDDFSVSPE